jgi:hypothetical protein
MADAAELIQSLTVLSLQPGDIVVLKTNQFLSHDVTERLLANARSKVGDHEVMILDGGLDLAVLRKELEPA